MGLIDYATIATIDTPTTFTDWCITKDVYDNVSSSCFKNNIDKIMLQEDMDVAILKIQCQKFVPLIERQFGELINENFMSETDIEQAIQNYIDFKPEDSVLEESTPESNIVPLRIYPLPNDIIVNELNKLEKQRKLEDTYDNIGIRKKDFTIHQNKYREVLQELDDLMWIPPNMSTIKMFSNGGKMFLETTKQLENLKIKWHKDIFNN